jgi:hypothetical protein
MQIELALAVDRFSRAKLAIAQLLAHFRRHLQLADNPSLWTNSQKSGVAVLSQDHGPGIVTSLGIWYRMEIEHC